MDKMNKTEIKQQSIFEKLIQTIERNAIDNITKITNVSLFAKSWRREHESKSNWISVEDGLPEIEVGYLILTHENIFYGHFDLKYKCFMSIMNQPQNVTHWMPLPTPPKTN